MKETKVKPAQRPSSAFTSGTAVLRRQEFIFRLRGVTATQSQVFINLLVLLDKSRVGVLREQSDLLDGLL